MKKEELKSLGIENDEPMRKSEGGTSKTGYNLKYARRLEPIVHYLWNRWIENKETRWKVPVENFEVNTNLLPASLYIKINNALLFLADYEREQGIPADKGVFQRFRVYFKLSRGFNRGGPVIFSVKQKYANLKLTEMSTVGIEATSVEDDLAFQRRLKEFLEDPLRQSFQSFYVPKPTFLASLKELCDASDIEMFVSEQSLTLKRKVQR